MNIIASLTTYPKRFQYLQKAIQSVVSQSAYNEIDIFYINIDDNLQDIDYSQYEKLKYIDSKIQIKICPAKWKSCNKLIWVYKDHPDDVIICFDDDKEYPSETLKQLLDMWKKHQNCIIAQEINPIMQSASGSIDYVNMADIKLNQIEFGKYLSNACLFPPHAFTNMLFDYDEMMAMTNGTHDELWFWLVSTLNNVQCIGLDYTYSYALDEIGFAPMESDLSNINANNEKIANYNAKINSKYKNALTKIIFNNPVKIFISHNEILKLTGNIQLLHALYGQFPIQIYCDNTIALSWIKYLQLFANNYKWYKFSIIPFKQQ